MNSGEPDSRKELDLEPYPVTFLSESERNELIDRIEQFASLTLSSHSWEVIAAHASKNSGLSAKAVRQESPGEDPDSTGEFLPAFPVEEEELEEVAIPGDAILRDVDGKNIALIHIRRKVELETPVPASEGLIAVAGAIEIVRLETVIRGNGFTCATQEAASHE